MAAGNYASGVTTTDVSPLGSTLSQRLLQLFGEGPADGVHVFYFITSRDYVVRDGAEYPFETTDYPKIQRVRELFPEATIIATDVMREHVEGGHFSEFAGMISE